MRHLQVRKNLWQLIKWKLNQFWVCVCTFFLTRTYRKIAQDRFLDQGASINIAKMRSRYARKSEISTIVMFIYALYWRAVYWAKKVATCLYVWRSITCKLPSKHNRLFPAVAKWLDWFSVVRLYFRLVWPFGDCLKSVFKKWSKMLRNP